nr:small ribosomal subunit protein eS28 isoform X1 [Delphinus delphis]
MQEGARDSSPPDQSPCRHYGYESCAAHQACQGNQGAGQDRFAGTVHAGARRIHGRHEPFHHPKRERPRARGRRAHPIGVRARGSEAALNLGLGPGCMGRLPGARG